MQRPRKKVNYIYQRQLYGFIFNIWHNKLGQQYIYFNMIGIDRITN